MHSPEPTWCPHCQKMVEVTTAPLRCPTCGRRLASPDPPAGLPGAEEEILKRLQMPSTSPDLETRLRRRWIRLAIVAIILGGLVLALIPLARFLHEIIKAKQSP